MTAKPNDEISRRRFMSWFARSMLGVQVLGGGLRSSRAATGTLAKPGRAKNVIHLFLRGGLSHIDSFDPKPGKTEMAGVKAIGTSAEGIQVSEWFPRLARQMHHVSLVRSITSTQGVHARGTYLAHTSYMQTATMVHPALGAWAVDQLGSVNPRLPGNVLICGNSQHPGAGFLPAALSPLPIGDPAAGLADSKLPAGITDADLQRRTHLAAALSEEFRQRSPKRDVGGYREIHERAVALMKSEDLQAFDIARENTATRAAYGGHRFGQGCLLARRLVEHGVRYVQVEDPQNWDTHFEHRVQMSRMTPLVDQSIAALLHDLHQRGLLESTLVVLATEFGRSPKINPNGGRDHHPEAFTWWVAGGGMKAGFVLGSSDATGERVAERPVQMADFNATLAHALGLDIGRVKVSPSGRPFTVANDGQPIAELFV